MVLASIDESFIETPLVSQREANRAVPGDAIGANKHVFIIIICWWSLLAHLLMLQSTRGAQLVVRVRQFTAAIDSDSRRCHSFAAVLIARSMVKILLVLGETVSSSVS